MPEADQRPTTCGRATPHRSLVAYVVPAAGCAPTAEQLRAHLRESLPDHMIPSVFVSVDEIPLTDNGKLDRAALPAPVLSAGSSAREPASDRERSLCGLFAEVLDLSEVGVDDDFLALGGDSVQVMRLIARMRSTLAVDVTASMVFEAPTVARLAERITSLASTVPTLERAARPQHIPLSPAQARLWFLDQLDDEPGLYNTPIQLLLRGTVEPVALEDALNDVVARHEILRTRYAATEDGPGQTVVPAARHHLALERLDCDEFERDRLLDRLAHQRLVLTGAPPIRAALLCVGDEEHVLALSMHHILMDGWSVGPLLEDLAAAYESRTGGAAPSWSPLDVQYADYALWQQRLLGRDGSATDGLEEQLGYWVHQLRDLPEGPVFQAAPDAEATPARRGGAISFDLPGALHERLLALARAEGATLFMVLQTALVAVLEALGAGDDFATGTAVAGRSDPRLERLIGFFVNTVVLRNDASGNPSLSELLARVRATAIAAYEHQDVPFEQVVERLNPIRVADRHPVFQTMLTLHNTPRVTTGRMGDLTVERLTVESRTAKFDLDLQLTERRRSDGSPDGLTARLEHATARIGAAAAEAVVRQFTAVLETMVSNPEARLSDLDLLSAGERRNVLETWSGRNHGASAPRATVHELFERQAALHPTATAVVDGMSEVSYRELNQRANGFARQLLSKGASRGEVVAVVTPRGAELVWTLLAVLKLGGAYMLLDPRDPEARLRELIALSGARLAVLSPTLGEQTLPESGSCLRLDPTVGKLGEPEDLDLPVGPDDLACVMFTSGSTGRPKAVAAPHRAIVTTHTASYLDRRPETFLQSSPVPWDAFSLELFSAILHGGRCVIQPGQAPEMTAMERLTREHGVGALQLSTSLFNVMIDEGSVALDTPTVMIGGEAASVSHVAAFLARHPESLLINGYGPVESMGFTTTHAITAEDAAGQSVPIGRPVDHKEVYLLDRHLRPVPPGTIAELYIGGAGLAHGYVGQLPHTAERFVPNPYGAPGSRLYRSGDFGRWEADGMLTYHGRADGQIKVRGFRIEPTEVETTLVRHLRVTQAAVVVKDGPDGAGRLVAYVVPAGDSTETSESLHAEAARLLPEHLLPSAIVVLPELPLTANGKVDRARLPDPGEQPQRVGRAPSGGLESDLCRLMGDVLGAPSVAADDDFFGLGGHSLLATRLIARVRSKLGAELSMRTVFDHPTPAALAEAVASAPQVETARPSLARRS